MLPTSSPPPPTRSTKSQPASLSPGIYGALAKAHMDRYETNLDHLLKVGIKNHVNGKLNPKAQFNVSIRDLMDSRKARAEERGQPVPEWKDEMDFLNDAPGQPLDRLASAPVRLRPPLPTAQPACCWWPQNWLATSPTSQSTSWAPARRTGRALHDAEELTSLIRRPPTPGSQAYQMAGVTAREIQVAEVHDCFTIAEIIATEDLGFFEPGEGPRAVDEGRTGRTGRPSDQHLRRS